MSLSYTTLDGERIPLNNITEPQREVLKELFELYRSNPTFPEFANTAYSQDSLKRIGAKPINNRYYIDKRLIQADAYNILKDLEAILGIQQGFFRAEPIDNAVIEENQGTLEKFLE